jgi:dynein intermediate chain 2
MEIVYVYTKKRAEFGRQCNFSDCQTKLHTDIAPDDTLAAQFIDKNPCDRAVQNAPEMSEHQVSLALATPEKAAQHVLLGVV